MAEENKNGSGAPSTDTTSALFVSARKKQLEQQEEARRAKEKEAQRLAAEAEVHRLEQEVEERRRKAEEAALLVETQARENREQADGEKRVPTVNMREPQKPIPLKKAKKIGKIIFLIIGSLCIMFVGFVVIEVLLEDASTAGALSPPSSAAQSQVNNSFDIIGTFFAEGDPYGENIVFYEEGTFVLFDENALALASGTWEIDADSVLHLYNEDGLFGEMLVADNNTIYSGAETGFYREGTVPSSDSADWTPVYDTFYDQRTGVAFSYPEHIELMYNLTGDPLELVTAHDSGNYLIIFDITQEYAQSSQVATDFAILNAMMGPITSTFFKDIYGSSQGIVEDSVVDGGDTEILAASYECVMMSDTDSYIVSGGIQKISSNRILLIATITLYDSEEIRSTFIDIMYSMEYIAAQ